MANEIKLVQLIHKVTGEIVKATEPQAKAMLVEVKGHANVWTEVSKLGADEKPATVLKKELAAKDARIKELELAQKKLQESQAKVIAEADEDSSVDEDEDELIPTNKK